MREPSADKSERKLNTFIPYEQFKIEGLRCQKFLLEQNDFLCKIDLKDAYFETALCKQSSKNVRFKWSSNQPLLVFVPLFWFRASSKSFYQITKNSNCSFETNKHSNNCLSGRYVADGEDLAGNYDSKGYFDFSIEKFGVCHKPEKVNHTTSETIGISGVTDKYRENDTVSQKKNWHI